MDLTLSVKGREDISREILLKNSKVICRRSLHLLVDLNT